MLSQLTGLDDLTDYERAAIVTARRQGRHVQRRDRDVDVGMKTAAPSPERPLLVWV